MKQLYSISDEDIKLRLQAMVDDPKLITESSYSPDSGLYPDHVMTFIERHTSYIRSHKHVDPDLYLSNIKLMITRR